MKKILLTLTSLLLTLSLYSIPINAEDEILVNVDYSYNATTKILSNNTISFKNKTIIYSTFVVPTIVNIQGTNYVVSTISKDAFNGRYISKIDLPNTITKVNSKAFVGDTGLTTLIIRSPNIVFHKNAFKGLSRSQLRNIKVVVDVNQVPWTSYKRIKKSLISLGILKSNIDLRDC